jgi:hypothetical protein
MPHRWCLGIRGSVACHKHGAPPALRIGTSLHPNGQGPFVGVSLLFESQFDVFILHLEHFPSTLTKESQPDYSLAERALLVNVIGA